MLRHQLAIHLDPQLLRAGDYDDRLGGDRTDGHTDPAWSVVSVFFADQLRAPHLGVE
jgi:hypothetical protein